MLTTIILVTITLALLVIFNFPGISWRRVRYREQVVIITLNDQARKELVRQGVWYHVWWPLQFSKIYSTLPSMVELPPARLPTGGAHPLEINVNGFDMILETVDAGLAYDAPEHNPAKALHQIAISFLTASTSKFDVNELARGQLAELKAQTLERVSVKGREWGVRVHDVILHDIDWPQPMLDASAAIMVAEAQAEAERILSRVEVENFERERNAEGTDYRWRQTQDALVRSVEKGLRFIGSDALLALLGFKEMGGEK